MTDNATDETLLEGEVDDNEYVLDNEKEDALLAGIEFDIMEGETYYAANNVTVQSDDIIVQESETHATILEPTNSDIIEPSTEEDMVETVVKISEIENTAVVITHSTDNPVLTESLDNKIDCEIEDFSTSNSSENDKLIVESSLSAYLEENTVELNENHVIGNDILLSKNDEDVANVENEMEEPDQVVKMSDDEEESQKDERDRFKTERSNILSLKNSIGRSGRTWDNIPDSLDDVIVPGSESTICRYNRYKKPKQQQQHQHQQQQQPQQQRINQQEHDLSPSEPQQVPVIIHNRTEQRTITKRHQLLMLSPHATENSWGIPQAENNEGMQYNNEIAQFHNTAHHHEYPPGIPIPHRFPSLPPHPGHSLVQPQVQPQPMIPQWNMQQQPIRPHIIEHHQQHQVQPSRMLQHLAPRHDVLQPSQIQMPPPHDHTSSQHQLYPIQQQRHPSLMINAQRSPRPFQYQELPPQNAPYAHQPFQEQQHYSPRPQQTPYSNPPPQTASFLGVPRQLQPVIHRPSHPNDLPIMHQHVSHLQPPPLVTQRALQPRPVFNFQPQQHLRTQVPSFVPNMSQQPPTMPPHNSTNMFANHQNLYSCTNNNMQPFPSMQSVEPPPPGVHEPIKLPPANIPTTMNLPINNQNPTSHSRYETAHENSYHKQEANLVTGNNFVTPMSGNSCLSQKRYPSDDNKKSSKRRYESYSHHRKDTSPEINKKLRTQVMERGNLIHLKPATEDRPRRTESTNTYQKGNSNSISRTVRESKPTNVVNKTIQSNLSKIENTPNRIVHAKNITSTSIRTQIVQNTIPQIRLNVIPPSRQNVIQHNRQNIIAQNRQNTIKIPPKISGNIDNCTESNIQEVHQLFRLKCKGGKVLYRSIPVDPKMLEGKSNVANDIFHQTTNEQSDSTQNPRRLVVSNISNVPAAQKGVVIKQNTHVECESIRQAAATVSKRNPGITLGERFSNLKPPVSEDDEGDKSKQDVNLKAKAMSRLVVVASASSRVVNNVGNQNTKVVVKNIASTTTSSQIRKEALTCGRVKKIVWNSVSPSKNEAEITFYTSEEAQLFCNRFNRKMIDLSLIIVSIVKE